MADMKPKWIIEEFQADNKSELLAKEAEKQGCCVEFVRYIPFSGGKYGLEFDEYDCIIVQTSINLARQLQREKKWVPGPWMNSKAYECTSYYAHLGKHHLNSDYIMIPRKDLPRRIEFFRDIFQDPDGALFIRPSTGQKSFTGKVFHVKHWEKDWEYVEEYTNEDSILIIAAPKPLSREWRFVATKKEIVTGSLYKERVGPIYSGKYREVCISEDYKDALAFEKACSVLKEGYTPDPLFVIDICEDTNGKFHLLEIGSFSCAGLYSCNLKKIVAAANQAAIEEWTDLNFF